jgi:Homoserine acetyltransferase
MQKREADCVLHDFVFTNGQQLSELKIHCTIVGERTLDGSGRTTNAVLLLHPTTATSTHFFTPSFADQLFHAGQPLDASKYFLIMPDGIGRGDSSKPSDGLQSRFPVYGYRDLVHAQYRLVTEGLGIDHLNVILGSSMGGMHAWLWAEQYPAMMDAIVPIACAPMAVTGRNYLWRHLIIEAIKHDPEYHEGRYTSQPRAWQRVLPLSYLLMNSAQTLEAMGKTHAAAKHNFEAWVEAARKNYDANDFLYWFQAVDDYDPEADLGNITAHVLAINFAVDLLNPVELGALERAFTKVKHGRYVIIPDGPDSNAHLSLVRANLWASHLQSFLAELEPKI